MARDVLARLEQAEQRSGSRLARLEAAERPRRGLDIPVTVDPAVLAGLDATAPKPAPERPYAALYEGLRQSTPGDQGALQVEPDPFTMRQLAVEAARRIPKSLAQAGGSLLDSINVVMGRLTGRPDEPFLTPGPRLKKLGAADEERFAVAMGRVVDAMVPPESQALAEADSTITRTGEGVGSGLSFLIPGAAMAKAPRIAQLVLTAGNAAAQEMAGAYAEAKAAGATEEEAWTTGLATGAFAGPTELIPISRMLARWDRASGGTVGRMLTDMLLEGVEEGAQEITQQAIGDVIAKSVYDEERQVLREWVKTGAAGALSGMFLSVLVSGGAAARARMQGRGNDEAMAGQTEQAPGVPGPGAGEGATALGVPEPGVGSAQPQLQTLAGEPIVAEPDPEIPLQPVPASGSVADDGSSASLSSLSSQGSSADARTAEEPDSSPGDSGGTSQSPADDGPTTSTKHRIVDAELAEMGLPPATRGERRAWEELNAQAEQALKDDPLAASKIAERLESDKRPASDLENFVLMRERNRLRTQRSDLQRQLDEATASGDELLVQEIAGRIQGVQDDILRASNVSGELGTLSGQALAARRAEIKEDYSLANMELAVRAAQGGAPLSAEQQAEIVDLNKRIDAAMAKVAEVEKRQAEIELERVADDATKAIAQTVKRTPRRRGPVLTRLSQEAQAARERMRQRATWMRSGPNTQDLADQIIIGADILARTAADFAAWSSEMVKEFGEKIRPYLQTIFDYSRRQAAQYEAEEIAAKVKAAGDDVPPVLIRKLAEVFAREGILEREPLVDAVHGALPHMERSAVARAMAGYGEFTPLSKDAIKVRLREIRGELRELAKLEDMEKGLVPQKSGPERQAPTDEQRRLIKKVNEAKKKLGIRAVTDPDRSLKTALDTIKTRLRNQIADLTRQIDTKARDIKVKTPGPRDAEVAELERQRDALQAQFDEVFAQEKQADRIPALQRALEKSIEDYERRIATGDIAPRKAGAQPNTPEIEALRARRDALREELALLRQPASSLQAAKTRMANEIARLREAITYGDFRKRAKPKPVVLDQEGLEAKAHLDALRREHAEGIERARLRNRTKGQKARDFALEVLNDLPKALKTAWDHSAVLRQGLPFTVDLSRIPTTVKALGQSLRAMGSEEYARRVESEINHRPLAAQAKAAGLELTSWGSDLTRAEEAIRSHFSDKIPGVKASNRAFSTYLNLHRATAFDLWMLAAPNATLEEQRAFAGAINVFTGRADVGPELSRHLNTAGKVLWSPRLWLSRLQLMAGQPLWKGTARTRKLIAAQMARSILGWMALRTLASLTLGADDDETDPRSSDFGKIRVGDYRLDPGAGILQNAVLAARVLAGVITPGEEFKSTKTGKFRELRIDDLFRFLQNKVTPTIGAGLYARFGDYENDDPGAVDIAKHLLAPLSFQGMLDAMRELGVPRGAAVSALSWFGWGLQNYANSKPPKKPDASLAGAAR